MFRKAYAPGESVPSKTCFWVHHYRHRLPHLGRTLFKTFPVCATCGERVRYEPVIAELNGEAKFLRFDCDFEGAWKQHRGHKSSGKGAD